MDRRKNWRTIEYCADERSGKVNFLLGVNPRWDLGRVRTIGPGRLRRVRHDSGVNDRRKEWPQ